jgi:probable HAF family extracellular repeat protein
MHAKSAIFSFFLIIAFSTPARAELPPGYTFTFIPELQGPLSINNAGQILGTDGTQGLLWQNGHFSAVGGLASGLNDSGQIAGTLNGQATMWSGTAPTTLQSLVEGEESHATGINNAGQVIGWSGSQSEQVPVIWNGTTPTSLQLSSGRAMAINNNAQVVGEANFGTGSELVSHAFLWEGGAVLDLGTVGPDRPFSIAQSINDAGQVVGFSFAPDFGNHAAFTWENGVMTPLAGFEGGTDALDINNHGQIVGQFGAPFGGDQSLAVLWDAGDMYDLNSFLDPQQVDDGWALFFASSINDQGQIIGFAFNHVTSASGAFLLTPVPEPETYALLMAGLGLLVLVRAGTNPRHSDKWIPAQLHTTEV